MKKYINLLLILSLLPAINGNADNLSLLNEGKSWVYDVINALPEETEDADYVVGAITSDTDIDGTMAKIVEVNYFDNNIKRHWCNAICRETNGVIREYTPLEQWDEADLEKYGHEAPWIIKMDMNLQEGDIFHEYIVKKVDHINVKGIIRKRIFLAHKHSDFATEILVEGIGWMNGSCSILGESSLQSFRFRECRQDDTTIFTYDDFFATSIEDSLIPTLIDEDKIWEYYRVGYVEDKGSTDQILTRYGFDGTREVNGKTYHRLMLVSVDKWRYNSFTGYFPYGSPTSIPEHKDVNECVALMREEAGKVYLYMDTDNKSSLQKYESKNNAPLYATVPDSKEVLVYDFSLSVGDEMEHWLVIDTGSWKPEEEWTFNYRDPRFGGTMITSQIAAVESIDSGKMGTLRKLHVNREDSQVNYVEKVGPTGYGNLFFLAGGPNLYDNICGTVVMFNNLYDRSGNVLYEGKGINVPSESDMGLLREDRKWDYTIEYRTSSGTSTFTSEGYHMTSIDEPYSGGFFTFIHPDGTKLATVRQDKSKVWLQIMEDVTIRGLDGKLIPKYEDVLLYDFSLKTGDRFECAGFDYSGRPNGRMMDCVITDTYDVEYNGSKRRCQEFRVEGEPEDDAHLYKAVEGVGNLCGLLPFPQFGVWEEDTAQEVAYVRYLRDMKDNIVYEGDPTAGTGTVLEDIIRNSENRYDLFGRRIREAAPGQVYIENGRKRVGK